MHKVLCASGFKCLLLIFPFILEMDEFSELKEFLAPKIAGHPSFAEGFDLSLASWLDPSDKLLKSYRKWKNSCENQGQTPDLQSRHLLDLWKERFGESKATIEGFKEAIIDKDLTGQLIEEIDRKLTSFAPSHGDTRRMSQPGTS